MNSVIMKSVLWNLFPFKTCDRRISVLTLFFSRLILCHSLLAQTPNTLYSSTSEMDENPAEPTVYCHESNRRGQPDPFTFISLNSFNSSWREEEGGCKTNEKSEQRSSFCPRNKSTSSKDSQCRQRLTMSTLYDNWHMNVRGRGRREGWALAFWWVPDL